MSTILGERVQERLDALERSQEWLAKRVGMKQQGIGSIIKGKSKRPRKLREIAVALETTQEYLLGETDDPRPPPSDRGVFSDYSALSVDGKRAVADLAARIREIESSRKRRPSQRSKAAPKQP